MRDCFVGRTGPDECPAGETGDISAAGAVGRGASSTLRGWPPSRLHLLLAQIARPRSPPVNTSLLVRYVRYVRTVRV